MVACTFLSAPLMFISAKMLTLTNLKPSNYINDLDSFLFDISIVSTIATVRYFIRRLLSFSYSPFSTCLDLICIFLFAELGNWCIPRQQKVGKNPALLYTLPRHFSSKKTDKNSNPLSNSMFKCCAVFRLFGRVVMVKIGLLRQDVATLPAVLLHRIWRLWFETLDSTASPFALLFAHSQSLLCAPIAQVFCLHWVGSAGHHRSSPPYNR